MLTDFLAIFGILLLVLGGTLALWTLIKHKEKYNGQHRADDVKPLVGKYWHPTGTNYPNLWMESIDKWIEGRKTDPKTIANMLKLKGKLRQKWDNYNELSGWKWLELYRLEQYQW